MLSIRAAAVGITLMCCASGVLAQTRTIQFDLNDTFYQAFNSGGIAVPFGGITHTGSVKFDMHVETILNDFLIRTGPAGNPFVHQASFSGPLSALSMTILLSNGNVTGGSLEIDINGGPSGGGDSYIATIEPGGSVQESIVPAPGAFTIDSLTSHGHFSDDNFGGVAIADFYASQSVTPFLNGSFLAFKILPNAFGKGSADIDMFVSSVPSPASLCLLGIGGLVAGRRRR